MKTTVILTGMKMSQYIIIVLVCHCLCLFDRLGRFLIVYFIVPVLLGMTAVSAYVEELDDT